MLGLLTALGPTLNTQPVRGSITARGTRLPLGLQT